MKLVQSSLTGPIRWMPLLTQLFEREPIIRSTSVTSLAEFPLVQPREEEYIRNVVLHFEEIQGSLICG
jgi:hypothetical protein